MPEIIIQNREDITDKVKLNLNGNIRIIDRDKQVSVNDSELDILMNSHEKPYIFVIPGPTDPTETEEINGDTDSTIGTTTDPGGDEASPRKNRKFW